MTVFNNSWVFIIFAFQHNNMYTLKKSPNFKWFYGKRASSTKYYSSTIMRVYKQRFITVQRLKHNVVKTILAEYKIYNCRKYHNTV